MNFHIDVDKWLRAEGRKDSWLLRPADGKMCCIGQMCLQLGVPKEELRGVADLRELARKSDSVKDMLRQVNMIRSSGGTSDWVSGAYAANDYHAARCELRRLVATAGHTLTFSDEVVERRIEVKPMLDLQPVAIG